MKDTDHLVPRKGTPRFGELERAIPRITLVLLTKRHGGLERDSVVSRHVYSQIPPKGEYSPTEKGVTVIPVPEPLCDWGIDHIGIPMIQE